MNLWRAGNRNDLAGLGGEKANGRWHKSARGKRIVYFGEHPAVALIEILVSLKGNPELLPDSYQLIKAEASSAVSVSLLNPDDLPPDWRYNIHKTQMIGDDWL
jgi:RES domain-containing protein